MRVYPYGASYLPNQCNGADHDTKPEPPDGPIDNAVLATGSMTGCKSMAEVFDLSGNVKEWVNQTDSNSSSGDIFVVRGGSYESPRLGLTCQTALSQQVGSSVLPGLGFRCCSDAAP
jgi:hypothetical protein